MGRPSATPHFRRPARGSSTMLAEVSAACVHAVAIIREAMRDAARIAVDGPPSCLVLVPARTLASFWAHPSGTSRRETVLHVASRRMRMAFANLTKEKYIIMLSK